MQVDTATAFRARCTNVVHDLGSADPVQLNGHGYTVDDADWSTTLGLQANYNDVTVTRNANETVQYRLAVICSNVKFP